jgi:hypothetical protein
MKNKLYLYNYIYQEILFLIVEYEHTITKVQ